MRSIERLYIIIAILWPAFAACKKNNTNDRPSGPPAEPFKTEKGIAIGNPVSKTIGAAGGSVTSADGKLTLIVPAGAVSTNTDFSIQPIAFMLPGSEGDTAYRLMPEGITFSKDVDIVFHYKDADIAGTVPDLLLGCYQTAAGNWASVPSALNKNNHTLTLTTKHFSDWGITSLLQLKIEKPVLSSLEETDIEIVGITQMEGDDLILAPLTPTYDVDGIIEVISDWEVIDGGGVVGSMTATPYLATYSPYSPVTHGAKAHVSVEIKGNMDIYDPSLPEDMRIIKKVILIAEITLVNDVNMIGQFNGQDIMANNAEAYEASGYIFINGVAVTDSSTINMTLQISAVNPGIFPCGSLMEAKKTEAKVNGAINQKPIEYYTRYIHCDRKNEWSYSTGSATIDNWGPVGTHITGSFSGSVYQTTGGGNCSPPPKGFNITFRAIRAL
ncbi:MAG: hypothetical protein QM731_01990 [Chitinophagaceae bacterium]